MSLVAYTKICGLISGGINQIFFVLTEDLTSFTLVGEEYTAVTMEAAKLFVEYDFKQDECELKMDQLGENGASKFTNAIEFMLDKLSTNSRTAIHALVDTGTCGVIAIIVDNNAQKWVLGYSEAHLKKRPLEVATGVGTTGKGLTDANSMILTLQADSKDMPRIFTGTIPIV